MDLDQPGITLHPQLLNRLFASKSKTRSVFRDVLGLHEVNHVAMAYIHSTGLLTTLSSTPSLEYNLFSSPLWQYDRVYDPTWFRQSTHAYWQALYSATRYDELYYLKQIKPHYPLGIALSEPLGEGHVVYSLASATDSESTRDCFTTQLESLTQLGQYCMTHLRPLLMDSIESSTVGTL